MGCFSGLIKYILFFFNFLIVVCAVALIAIGSIIVIDENKGFDRFTEFSVGGFAIAVGVIIFFIAFFGCCGALKENSCMLTTYIVILVILLVLQVVLGALALVAIQNDDDKLDDEVRKVVKDAFEDYFNDMSNKDKQKIIDDVQQAFECCGIDSKDDWKGHGGVPPSCYPDKEMTQRPFGDSCVNRFQEVISENIKAIGGVAIGFAAIELVAAIFACIVRNRH